MASSSSSQASSLGVDPSLIPGFGKSPITKEYYKMLMNGERNFIDEIMKDGIELWDLEWAPNKSTVLHIAAGAGQKELVSAIARQEERLVYCPNSEGNLPIHVAVKSGQMDVVKALLELENQGWQMGREQQMLERENHGKNTALHIALENRQDEIAKLLFHSYPEAFYHLNKRGISPLYLAVKRELWPLAKMMLQPRFVEHSIIKLEIAALREPGARSVVHAMILARNRELIAMLHNHYPELLDTVDEHGTRALAYAAYTGFIDGVQYFLSKLPQHLYEHNDDGSFPIHKACSGGNLEIVKEFFKHFQNINAKFMLNIKDQNILHGAALNGKVKVVEYLLKDGGLNSLINMKDKDGNTPLHLATMGKHPKVVYTFTSDQRVDLTIQNNKDLTAFDLAGECVGIPSLEKRLTWLALLYANAPASPQTMDVDLGIQSDDENVKSKLYYKDRLNTLLMVSTLIVTVTFAAGFTAPGGYRSSDKPDHQQGMATLARSKAFQVFVLSDTTALFSSIFAAMTLIWAHLDDPRLCLKSLSFALPLLAVAFTMMSVAFTAGLFVVLYTLCNWLAVVVLVMGCAFLPLTLAFLLPLFFPQFTCKNHKFLHYAFHLSFTFILWAFDLY